MASYIDKALLPDERIVYFAHLHWVLYLKGLMITIFGGVLGFYSHAIVNAIFGTNFGSYLGKPLAGAALVIVIMGTALLAGAYLRQTSTELAVTNRRIIAKYGFISRTTFEIMISRVTGSNFEQTMVGRVMNYGTILVHGAGGEISPFDMVAHPEEFQRALMFVLEHVQSGFMPKDKLLIDKM